MLLTLFNASLCFRIYSPLGRLLSDNRVSHCWTGLFSFPPFRITNLIIFAWLLIYSFARFFLVASFIFGEGWNKILLSWSLSFSLPRFFRLPSARTRRRETFSCKIMILIFFSLLFSFLSLNSCLSNYNFKILYRWCRWSLFIMKRANNSLSSHPKRQTQLESCGFRSVFPIWENCYLFFYDGVSSQVLL